MKNTPSHIRGGLVFAFLAYLIWGVLPVYWKVLAVVPYLELISWRVAGCGVIAWIIILFRRRLVLKSLLNVKIIFLIIIAAILIAINWILFLWAVGNGRILEASLGYYINPLVNVILGIIFFSETLGKIRFSALLLALAGVIIMTLATGTFPWVSVLLALSFGSYGMVTKGFPSEIDSIEALAWEMVILSPVAIVYLIFLGLNGSWHFVSYGSANMVMLVLAGVVTLGPLWMFGIGAKRLPLGMMGFLQYITPTLMFILGVFVYGEPFSLYKAAAFIFILTAVWLYSSTLRTVSTAKQ